MRALLLFALACAACGDTTIFDPMERQPKYKAFSANPQYEDGRAMRKPPDGTVSREQIVQRPEITAAIVGATRPEQLDQSLPASGLVLEEEEMGICDQAWYTSG